MRPMFYTERHLEDGSVVVEPLTDDALAQWSLYLPDPRRLIATNWVKGVSISTVFLGIDHNFLPYGDPILYETMCFGPPPWDTVVAGRYRNRREAHEGHERVVAEVEAGR